MGQFCSVIYYYIQMLMQTQCARVCTCHVVVHPVEHDLRRSVPPGGHVASHFIICVPRQTKVQDLRGGGSFILRQSRKETHHSLSGDVSKSGKSGFPP